jgi:hypothetical protein
MQLSAAWSASLFTLDANVGVGDIIDLGFFQPDAGDRLSLGAADGLSGSLTDEILIASFLVPDGSDGLLTLFWQLQGSVGIEQGEDLPAETALLDAMNTAKIFVQTEGNVTATPLTPGFLSNPAYTGPGVAPVPLPASGLLFLAALGGLAGLRRAQGLRQAA